MDELLTPFQFTLPLMKAHRDSESGLRFIEGMASNDDWDQQDEQMVIGDGFDFGPLKKHGYINWNHSHKPEDQIGVPVECGIREHQGRPSFFIKAALLPDLPRADYVWTLLNSLEKFNGYGLATRTLGWSVEGGVLKKSNGRIEKAVIRHTALTQEPVNAATFAAICKSFFHDDDGPLVTMKTFTSGGDVNPTEAGAANDGGALRLENLSGGHAKDRDDADAEDDKDDPLTSVLLSVADFKRSLSSSSSPYYDARTGRFHKSWDGLYDHLTLVMRQPPGTAAEFIYWLRHLA